MPTDIEKFLREKQESVLGVKERPLGDAPEIEIDVVKGPGVEQPQVPPQKPPQASFAEQVKQKVQPTFAEQVKKEADRGFIRDYSRAFNGLIADALDLPGAAFASVLNLLPFKDEGVDPIESGGWRQLFVDAGLTDPEGTAPDTAGSAVGKFVAETMLLLPVAPLGAGVKGVRAAEMGFTQGAKEFVKGAGQSVAHPISKGIPNIRAAGESVKAGAKRFVKQVGDTAVKHPKSFAAAELTAGASAGFFGFAAKENFPNSELAEFWGNLAGGMAPSTIALGPARFVGRKIAQGAKRLRHMQSDQGARERASKRLGEAVVDKDAVLDELQTDRTLPGAALTPAQKSGDPILLALEKAIIDENTALAVRSDEQLAELNSVIINSMRARPESAELTRDALDETRGYINSLLDGRLKIAMLRIKERIQGLEPTAGRQQANEIARDEIEKALTTARVQENEFWSIVPMDVKAHPTASIRTWKKHLSEFKSTRTSDPDALPDDLTFGEKGVSLRKLLGDFNKKGKFIPGELRKDATVRELQLMRSKILKAIREEGGKPASNQNRIRILGDIQDSLLVDMGVAKEGATSESGALLQQALDFSADLNQRFTKGPVGRLLGMDKTGTPRAPSGLTLETSIGGGGPRAKANYDAIIKAVKDKPQVLKAAMEDYIKNRFIESAVRNDSIDIAKAEAFMRRNDALLDEFPEIKVDIERGIREENTRFIRERKVQRVGKKLHNARMSKAALYIEKDPQRAFHDISKSRNPSGEIGQLIKMSQRDSSGEAFKGLQESFMDWILERSMINNVDVRRQKIVSGFQMDRVVNEPGTKMMLETLLSVDQKTRIDQAIETALKMERALSSREAVEGVMTDLPHRILNDIMGVAGAQVGRMTARVTGGGTVQTPGIFARRARDLLGQFTKDNAKELLIDALTAEDTELLEALLKEIRTEADFEFVKRQLHGWLAVTAFENGDKIPGTTDSDE